MESVAIYVSDKNQRVIDTELNDLKQKVLKDYDGDSSTKIIVYIDKKKESLNKNVVIKDLLENVKTKKIKKLYINYINVFSYNNFIENYKIFKELFENECEIVMGVFVTNDIKQILSAQKEMYEAEKNRYIRMKKIQNNYNKMKKKNDSNKETIELNENIVKDCSNYEKSEEEKLLDEIEY